LILYIKAHNNNDDIKDFLVYIILLYFSPIFTIKQKKIHKP
jgi:hypothetical protein